MEINATSLLEKKSREIHDIESTLQGLDSDIEE